MRSISLTLFIFILIFPNNLKSQAPIITEYECPNPDNSFRGLSVLNDSSIWVSSNQGQVWYFQVGGGWENRSPKGYEAIQWRDIEAFNDSTALILSAGSPGLVLKTSDAGTTWREVYRDDSPHIFFDAMDFYGQQSGFAFADAEEEYLGMIETQDGGETWHKWENTLALKVWPQQGGFAASGSCIKVLNDSSWALVLGGKQAIFNYTVNKKGFSINLPLDEGGPSKGAFSLDFKNKDTLIVVGGDYRADSLSNKTITVSFDGGQTWKAPFFPKNLGKHYWSCVQWDEYRIVLCSRFGSAISLNNGGHWHYLQQGFYTSEGLWFSGPNGRIGRLKVAYK